MVVTGNPLFPYRLHFGLFTLFRSLQATWIRNSVIQVLRQADVPVRTLPLNFVYTAPSIDALSRYIAGVADPENNEVADPVAAKAKEIDELVAKYTANFHKHTPSKPAPVKETIFLTGSTGGLGSTVLAKLIAMESVERIYAVNRPSKGSSVEERQRAAFEDKGLDIALLSSDKVVFVEGDTSTEGFAIRESLYNEVRHYTGHCLTGADIRIDSRLGYIHHP